MSTRSLAARLKRIETRYAPGPERPEIEIRVVDSRAQTLYKMRLGTPEHQYFSPDDQPISKEQADGLAAASERVDQP